MTTDFRELQKKNKRTTRLLLCASFFLVFLVSFVLGLALTGFLGFAIFALIFSFVLTFLSSSATVSSSLVSAFKKSYSLLGRGEL